jgi:transcriptional regulator with GAF, ATPase, and Fis domain
MTVDKNDFFRQATLRICSSLDIDTALERCFHHLKDFFPVSSIQLGLFDTESYTMKIVSAIGLGSDAIKEKVLVAPERHLKQVVSQWQSMGNVTMINRPRKIKYFRELFSIIGLSLDCSTLIMPLELEENRIGGLGIMADGIDQYTMKDAALVKLLHDPFAIALANALKHQEVRTLKALLEDDNRFLHDQLQATSAANIIGADFGLRQVMEKLRQVAPMDSPVLLQGETGVGKEVIAHALHANSPRADGPFIKVNCGAIPEHLIDSELFGHEKGAFTGAVAQKRGRFERAHNGTIFLDEIGELPPQAQVRLLHVLQNKLIERVGSETPLEVDIRVISATHRNLRDMVAAGQFREDLFFRINVFPIQIPPLRDRKEDIPALVSHFIEKKKRELKIAANIKFAPGSMENMMPYNWPGNIRELINVVERGLILHQNGLVSFAPHSRIGANGKRATEAELSLEDNPIGFHKLDEAMHIHIEKALKMCKGKISGPGSAAELLDVLPSTLRKRMDKLGIPFRRRSLSA